MARQSSKESTARLFQRYVWLVDLIYRHNHRITFDEIGNRWINNDMSEGEALPLRTFHNHRKAIEEMFDINIECDKCNGCTYFIENSEDMERGGVRQWLLNTFAVNNLINESHKLKDRILFEYIPSGQRLLTPIIAAMRDGRTLELTYQSFWRTEPHTFHVEPYCVKVFKQRWYLLGKSAIGLRVYALDRVQELVVTENGFAVDQDFDATIFFADCFGVIHNDEIEPQRVVLRVARGEHKDRYFEELPLHPSQMLLFQDDNNTLLGYHLRPTYDFLMELLSHGADVEVLEPQWFRQEAAQIIANANQAYHAEQ